MPTRKFEATEGLLHDVMRKQSGVIEKAYLEALMNSVDANATEFQISITEDKTVISDNGDSMTKPEVERYFEQFGLKDSDIQDKEFGKFRMGRGQIFNFGTNVWRAKENYMVVDLDNDQTKVTLPHCIDTTDPSIIETESDWYTLDTEGLSYALLDAEEYSDGLEIEIEHYNKLDSVSETVKEFKELAEYVSWFHDIDIVVNSDGVSNEPDILEETELAYYTKPGDSVWSNARVYNKGAFVDTFNLGPTDISVISKADLDVTLDRTDILDSDPYWSSIKDEYNAVTVSYLTDKDSVSTTESNWLLEKASSSDRVMKAIQDIPMLKDVNGDKRTLTEVSERHVGFASQDDKVAQDAMSRGDAIMIDDKHESEFISFANSANSDVENSNVRDYEDIIDDELNFEMSEISRDNLSKRREENLDMLESALYDLGFNLDVRAGYSNHKNVWKNKEDQLYIHKDELNSRRQDVATRLLQRVVVVAAHDGETVTSLNEDFSLNRNFYKAVSGTKFGAECDYSTVQNRILNGEY